LFQIPESNGPIIRPWCTKVRILRELHCGRLQIFSVLSSEHNTINDSLVLKSIPRTGHRTIMTFKYDTLRIHSRSPQSDSRVRGARS
jgi:hypothetical protein